MNIPILYEDNHLLVVQKPVNIPVQQDQSKDLDLLTLLKKDLKIRYKKPGNVFLALVHRLDRPVGGAMVFAKTSKAASRLSDVLRRQQLGRKYVAVVHGKPSQKKQTLTHFLVKTVVKISSIRPHPIIRRQKRPFLRMKSFRVMNHLVLSRSNYKRDVPIKFAYNYRKS